jgi:hypothetical protein
MWVAMHFDLSKPPAQMTAPTSTFTPSHTPLPVLTSYDEHGVMSWADTEANNAAQTNNCNMLKCQLLHLSSTLGAKNGLFSVALSCLVEVGCGGEAVKS